MNRVRIANCLISLMMVLATGVSLSSAQTQNPPTAARTPSDVVREFYKAMREKRFPDAFALTIYKGALDGLTAEELEDLRPGFEEKASLIPTAVEVVGEQINGSTAIVFVRIPVTETTPQVTSEPVNMINSGGAWIIGTETDLAEVKKAGRRYFLDALITEHEADVEDLLKRMVVLEGIFSQQHGGAYGDFAALMGAGMFSADVIDPKLSGYNFHITLSGDKKAYVIGAEPARHGRTGKLSFWMDQSGVIKSANNGGKPFKP